MIHVYSTPSELNRELKSELKAGRARLRQVLGAPLCATLLSLLLAGCGATLPQIPVVQIAPSSAQLQAGGGRQQFTATVLNARDTSVVWKVNGFLGGSALTGTITQTGLYSAPLTPPAGAVAVEAVSVANGNSQASAAITLTPAVAITLSPATATVAAGGTVQYTAVVTNTNNTGVTWSVNNKPGGSATLGAISGTGLYTAPATFPGLSQLTITATSIADTAVSANATLTLTQAIAVSVAPATATVATGGSQTFTATVTGTTNLAVTWAVNGTAGGNATLGTIDKNGVYTAPATIPSPAVVTVSATSAADPTKSATAAVTITAPVGVVVAPAKATLGASQTQQFSAQVTNASNTAVTWSVNGTAGGSAKVGTVSATGLYTAPSLFPGLTQVTVTATSVQDTTASGSATVTLQAPVAITINPTTATVDLGATQGFSATVTGTTNQAVTWAVNGTTGGSISVGTIDGNGLYTAPGKLPSPAQVTVSATSTADPTKSASAAVTLQVPPAQFTLSPASATMTLGKAATGSQTFQLTLSPGFANPVKFTVGGEPINVTGSTDVTTLSASGAVTLSLSTASISLAQSGVPITLSATSTDASGAPIVQTATVLLTITGWAGHLHTVAGGPGGVGFEDGTTTADEAQPTALVTDGGRNVYFADKRGTALRAFGLQNQTMTTLIGGPYNFTVADGEGMAFDPTTQKVYIADALRNRIVSFTIGGFSLTVVAGNDLAGYVDGVGAAARFSFPHGLAMSPDHTTLYVADTNNEVVRAITLATGAVTTLAGQHGIFRSVDGTGAAASFCQPTGLGIDSQGANLYLSDACGFVIRRITLPGAQVTTVAGTGTVGASDGAALSASFGVDLNAITVDPHTPSPVVYIADGSAIRALTLGANPQVYTLAGSHAPGQSDGTATQASFFNPSGLTALADIVGPGTTSLFIGDTDNGLIRRMDINNPLSARSQSAVALSTSTLAGQPSHRGDADGVGTGPGFTGVSVAQFSQPDGIVTDGKIAYVSDSINGAIRKIDLATTNVTTVAGPHQGFSDGPASSAAFFQNAGLAWVPSQNVIYVADTGNAAIRKLDLSSSTVTTLAGTNASGFADGSLTAARFNHPFGILASSDGTKLYIADTGNNAIRLIDLTAATVSTIAGNGGLGNADGVGAAARFAEPNGMAFDATGKKIYISDFENQAIRLLDLTTDAVTTVVGGAHQCGFADGPAANASLCDPAFLTSDGHSLFWGDSNTGLLRVLNLTTLQVSTLAGAPALLHMADGDLTEVAGELVGPVRYNGVFGMAIAPDASFILFTDKTANVVRIIN
ncbi:MAG TPA: hypothetical protein VIC32_03730 [Terriglobales bacterium]|jgi:DNA-binding beta-propeller fold protein YncE